MKVSVSALFLALGASDAFSPAPSKPTVTSLDAVVQMSGGTGGTSLMDDRTPPDINAPWGSNPIHNSPHYAAPSYPQSQHTGAHGAVMTGGTSGSSLMPDSYNQVNRDAPYGQRFPYQPPVARAPNGHSHNGMTGGTVGSKLVDGQIDRFSAYSTSFSDLHHTKSPAPVMHTPTNGHSHNGMTGGTAGSRLVDGQIDMFAAYSPSYSDLHGPTTEHGRIYSAAQEQAAAQVAAQLPESEATEMPPVTAAPFATAGLKQSQEGNPTVSSSISAAMGVPQEAAN